MRANFFPSLTAVLVHEGGKVDDPRDPGGRTNFGITQRVYDAWRAEQGLSHRDVWAIDPAERDAIYRGNYWQPIAGDLLPSGVDYATFDFAVNSGVNRAARFLQRLVGVADDGQIGPVSVAAINARDPKALIAALSNARETFLQSLPTFAHFGAGWSRRVAEVQAAAEAMA